MEQSSIQWTDNTFNPWIGCTKVSEGCKNCYAEQSTPARISKERGLPLWGVDTRRQITKTWNQPQQWNALAQKTGTRIKVFCASLADVFEDHPALDSQPRFIRNELFELIEDCKNLDWQLLTKRPENIKKMVPSSWLDSWPDHVWIGTTVENQKNAKRISYILELGAKVPFVSMEPLLENVAIPGAFLKSVKWVIVGGESGHNARHCNIKWIESIVYQCKNANVPVFVKQLGSKAYDVENGIAGASFVVPSDTEQLITKRLTHSKGGDFSEFPPALQVREFPV